MSIQKQEFYEGAALHRLIRGGDAVCISYENPTFVLEGKFQVLLKYSTAGRTPWAFTFAAEERAIIVAKASERPLVLGLVCGSDGIVALPFDSFCELAADVTLPFRIACERRHREHFEVRGPEGKLRRKIPPSDWDRLLLSFNGG